MRVHRQLVVALIATAIMAGQPVFAGVYKDILAAARNNRTEVVVDLIRRGMDVNTTDRSGTTLLMFAAGNGNEQLLDFLLKNGANVLIRNRYGDTAIAIAALKGRLGAVRRLAESGAAIDTPGWSPLHYAAFAGRTDIAEYLIGKQAALDAKAPNGRTALMLAARNGHMDVVKLLVAAGANEEIKDPDGKTAFDLAVKAGNTDIANFLGNDGTER
jgi:uncharacterized protein